MQAAGYRPTATARRPYPRLTREQAAAVVAAFTEDEQAVGHLYCSKISQRCLTCGFKELFTRLVCRTKTRS